MPQKFLSLVVFVLTMASPVSAAPIKLEFNLGYGVEAAFFGLDDSNLNDQAADYFSVEGVSNVKNSVFASDPDISSNSFFFDRFGELTDVDFSYLMLIDDIESYDYFYLGCDSIYCYYEEDSDRRYLDWGGRYSYTITPIAPVPLPSGGLLLLVGLTGLRALKHRKIDASKRYACKTP